MSQDFVTQVMTQGINLLLLISLPAVGVGLLVGFIISLFQAVTQIQEQTLTFVPKLVAIVLTLVFSGPWMMTQAVRFTQAVFELFPSIIDH